MKPIKSLLILLLQAAVALPALADTTNSPQANFIQTATVWFSTFDTNNMAFRGGSWMEMTTGPETQQGVGIDDLFEARITALAIMKSDPNYIRIEPGVALRNADIAGTLTAAQGEVAVTYSHWDAKLALGLAPGYSWVKKSGYAEVFVEVEKAMTQNTLMALRCGWDMGFKKDRTSTTPLVALILGATF